MCQLWIARLIRSQDVLFKKSPELKKEMVVIEVKTTKRYSELLTIHQILEEFMQATDIHHILEEKVVT